MDSPLVHLPLGAPTHLPAIWGRDQGHLLLLVCQAMHALLLLVPVLLLLLLLLLLVASGSLQQRVLQERGSLQPAPLA